MIMKKESFITKALRTVGLMANEGKIDVKLESIHTEDGVMIQSETFEPGDAVFIVAEDGLIPLPVSDYVLEDGRVLTVAEEGIISQIGGVGEEEEVAPPMQPEVEEEMDNVLKEEGTPKKVIESITKETQFSKEEEKVEAFELSDEQLDVIAEKVAAIILAKAEVEGEEVVEEEKEELKAEEPVELAAEEEIQTPKFNPEADSKKAEIKLRFGSKRRESTMDRYLAKRYGA